MSPLRSRILTAAALAFALTAVVPGAHADTRAPYETKIAPAPKAGGVRDLLKLGPKSPRRLPGDGRATRYENPGGKLYVNDVKLSDIRQGAIGDCYFLAAASALAQQRPNAIKDAFTHHPDGTLSVKLYRRNEAPDGTTKLVPSSVHIDRSVPVSRKNGAPIYAKNSGRPDAKHVEQWPMLLEKAFAKDNRGYKPIVGGNAGHALEVLTGQPSTFVKLDPQSTDGLFSQLRSASKERRPMVTVGSFNNDTIGERLKEAPASVRHHFENEMGGRPYTEPAKNPSTMERVMGTLRGKPVVKTERYDTGMVRNHAYTVLGVSESNGQKFVHVRNPWGKYSPGPEGLGKGVTKGGNGIFKLPIETFATVFRQVAIGGTAPEGGH